MATITTINGGNSKKRANDFEYDAKDKYPITKKSSDSSLKKPGQNPKFNEYARLNTLRSQILMEIEKEKDLRWLKPLRTDPKKRNKNLY